MKNQHLNCPNCNTPISFEIHSLIQGARFKCSNCDTSISLSASSNKKVKTVMEKLDSIKQKSI